MVLLRRCSQPKDQGTYLATVCVHLSSPPAADQMLLVPEPFRQSHITVFICECVPCFFLGVKSHDIKVYLLCFCTQSETIACYTGCIGE